MKIIIVGNGKLSQSLLSGLGHKSNYKTIHWNDFESSNNEKVIIIHAGSGREFSNCVDYCLKTESILVELSTSNIVYDTKNITLLSFPNTAIPILKLMMMLNEYGKFFNTENIEIKESHQESKKTTAGTAIELSKYFNISGDKIVSIRDKKQQMDVIGIPDEYINLHAYHQIKIIDEGCEIKIQTKVVGHKAYIVGVKKIIEFINKNSLEKRIYSIPELIQMGLR